MIELISSESRGSADHGWLKARHTFSFAEYQNPKRVHFGPLRVINEDRIAPGKGFGTHPHKDMEIVTYPISGAIEPPDSQSTRHHQHKPPVPPPVEHVARDCEARIPRPAQQRVVDRQDERQEIEQED